MPANVTVILAVDLKTEFHSFTPRAATQELPHLATLDDDDVCFLVHVKSGTRRNWGHFV